MATAAASPQQEVKAHDLAIERLKNEIAENEAELNLLQVKQRKASAAELPAILRRKEVVEANLDRDRAALVEETNASSVLWKTIRDEEERQRHEARIAEPERLKAEALKAIADYRAGLSRLAPESQSIVRAVSGLRRIMDSAPINSFPIAPECLAAQAGMREVNEALAALRATFEATLR
jgi:hypothetical protein